MNLLVLLAQTSSTSTTAGGGLGEAMGVVQLLAKAFTDRNWALVASGVLTLAIIAFRFFEVGKKVPAEWVPWVTLGLATLTSVAVGLQTKTSFWAIVSTGVAVGLMAVGGWETFAKMLRALYQKLKGPAGG